MKYSKEDIKSIDDYINLFPKEIQAILKEIRNTVRKVAPKASEAIRYSMPTFRLNGNMVHFAAHKNHIGFYPTPSAIIKFKDELKNYNMSKGAIQFALNEPIPYELISKIVTFRVSEQKLKK